MAKLFGYYDDWKSELLECPKCGWRGTFEEGSVEHHAELIDCSCPQCDSFEAPMLAIVSFPTLEESRNNADKLTDSECELIEIAEHHQTEFAKRALRDPLQLPEISSSSFTLKWDMLHNGFKSETLIKHGDEIIFREPVIYEGYERFVECARILRERYGSALRDLIPTSCSETYLYGDRLSAPAVVAAARREIFSHMPEGH
jgi:hypothetical protein